MKVPPELLHEFCLPQESLNTLEVELENRKTAYHFEYDTRNLSLMHNTTIIYTCTVNPEIRKKLLDPMTLEKRYKEYNRKLRCKSK